MINHFTILKKKKRRRSKSHTSLKDRLVNNFFNRLNFRTYLLNFTTFHFNFLSLLSVKKPIKVSKHPNSNFHYLVIYYYG